jgi:hypothetical protein
MAVTLKTTRQAAQINGLKMLVYAGSGAGKTTLCASTGGNPIIVSAESGLLSLRHTDIPVIEVHSLADVHEAYTYLATDPEGMKFDWVCIDSVSEIAEVVLAAEKAATKDPRKAYGELADQMAILMRAFRDLPGRNVYMAAKMGQTKEELTGAILRGPSAPGQQLAAAMPYWFDEVFCLRVEKDEAGNPVRWLQTGSDAQYICKDRSGALDMFEPADLSHIAAKILAG